MGINTQTNKMAERFDENYYGLVFGFRGTVKWGDDKFDEHIKIINNRIVVDNGVDNYVTDYKPFLEKITTVLNMAPEVLLKDTY